MESGDVPRGLQTQVLIKDGHGPYRFFQISILACCSQSSNASYVIDDVISIASANSYRACPNGIAVGAYADFSRDQQNQQIGVITHGSTINVMNVIAVRCVLTVSYRIEPAALDARQTHTRSLALPIRSEHRQRILAHSLLRHVPARARAVHECHDDV